MYENISIPNLKVGPNTSAEKGIEGTLLL